MFIALERKKFEKEKRSEKQKKEKSGGEKRIRDNGNANLYHHFMPIGLDPDSDSHLLRLRSKIKNKKR